MFLLAHYSELNVYFNHYGQRLLCGRLVLSNEKASRILFEYAPSFFEQNINISPFKLPLQRGQFYDEKSTFDGLMGVFDDSLPDGWGRLLIDRALREFYAQKKYNLNSLFISPLDRLALAGCKAMGALEYEPIIDDASIDYNSIKGLDFDNLADKSLAILQDKVLPLEEINKLCILNGSSGGARPKVLVNIQQKENKGEVFSTSEGEPWLIKFRNQSDSLDVGLDEYIYSILAKKAGIDMPLTRLFRSKNCAGFFGTKRFDRQNGIKIHTHSACGLLHANFRLPSMSYEGLLRLCLLLTNDIQEVIKLFRVMVFNVAIHNYDDHTKNFSFCMDEKYQWKLSPAYDLLPSYHCNEHATTVNNKGKDININDMLEVAKQANIAPKKAKHIIEKVYDTVSTYETLKKDYSG